ncbi:MAG: phosphate ABC transporter permease PstA [Oscillospiraceae bacterium]|nr:phosphate ABC transporter permease PstA [Oscillospiraceae bacterium]
MKKNQGISTSRKIKTAILKTLVYLSAVLIIAVVLFIVVVIVIRGLPNISWEFLTSGVSYLKGITGILPNILNTIYVVIMTLVIVLPVGTGAAIYLNEYAKNKKAVAVIEFATETLAGIPSIIYGLVGMLIFVQTFKLKTSLLAGSLTLVIMTLPTIIRTVQESLKTVPDSYREGSLALGSGKWHMVRTVVLPSAIDGIVTGCILSVGRIVGESAALLFTAGMVDVIYTPLEAITPNHAGSTLAVALYVYAKERADSGTAFAIAFILLILTLIINTAAKIAGKKLKRRTDND